MAGLGRFSVIFHGPARHRGLAESAMGEFAVMQAKFVLELQSFANDELTPQGATVRVVQISAELDGPAPVLPAIARVVGTTCSFTAEMHARISQLLREAARRITSGAQTTASVSFETLTPPVINPLRHAELAMQAANDTVGCARVIWMDEPITVGDDFAVMLEERPGALIFIGNGVSKDGMLHPLQTPQYEFNDEVISTGVAYWAKLVTLQLADRAGSNT